MSNPAAKQELNELHAALAKSLAKKIESGEATAADLSVARQFLKDNNIEALPTDGSPIKGLAASLPFAGTETYQ